LILGRWGGHAFPSKSHARCGTTRDHGQSIGISERRHATGVRHEWKAMFDPYQRSRAAAANGQ